MKSFIIMPEKGKWQTVQAHTADGAYLATCCWYSDKTAIAVMDTETGKTLIYRSKHDRNGNLIDIEIQ